MGQAQEEGARGIGAWGEGDCGDLNRNGPHTLMCCKYLSPQTKKYADVIIPRGADNLGEYQWGVLLVNTFYSNLQI